MTLDPKRKATNVAVSVYRKRLRPALGTTLKAAFKVDAEHGGRLAKGLFRSFEWIWAMGYVPILRDKIPALNPNLSNVSTLPINKDIEGGKGIALPEEVMDRLIEASHDRVIIKFYGTCVSHCFIGAIQLRAAQAVIDEYCRVCGRCAAACPRNAIQLKLDNPQAVEDVVSRILSKVDLS